MTGTSNRGGCVHTVTVPADSSRLDTLIADQLSLSRTRAQALINSGGVSFEGRKPRKAEVLPEGSVIKVRVPEPEATEIAAEDLGLPVLYEDQALCVVDKPAGMVTHPAPGHRSGTLVNALMHEVTELSGVGGRLRPGIVHRLDRDTSGLLVVAKHDAAHRALQTAIQERKVERLYTAASWGRLPSSPLDIEAPIGRHPRDRKRMAIVANGRHAFTRVRVVEGWRAAELLEVELGTGRTHQIRVHLAHVGHPVVGDSIYGPKHTRGFGGPNRAWARELARRTTRQFLHARKLAFAHPLTGRPMEFVSDLPPELAGVREWAIQALTTSHK